MFIKFEKNQWRNVTFTVFTIDPVTDKKLRVKILTLVGQCPELSQQIKKIESELKFMCCLMTLCLSKDI